MGTIEEQQAIDSAIAEFPARFKLPGSWDGTVEVYISRVSSFVNGDGQVMLYTFLADGRGAWCKGSPAELRRAIIR